MGLLDWLSDGLGLGNAASMGGGGMPPGVYPGGGQVPMPPVQQTGDDKIPPVPPTNIEAMPGQNGNMPPPLPQGTDPMTAGGSPPNGPGLPLPPGSDPMTAGGSPPNGPGLPGAPPPATAPGAPANLAPGGVDLPGTMASYAKAGGDPMMRPLDEVNGGKGNQTAKGILESALGLSPERATRVRGQLGAGLKSVAENANKPGLAAFAGSMGAGIEGGTKSDEKQTDQRTKLLNQMITAQAAGDKAAYTKSLTAYTQAKLEAEKTKAANPEAAAKSRSAMTEEQKLFKINDALAKDPQVKAAQHLLESTKRQGTPKEVAAAQKSFDDLFKTKKTEITEALRPGSATNPHKVTSQDDLKGMKPGDVYINPSDGKPYVFKGAKKEGASAAPAAAPAAETGAMTPAAQSGLPSPKAAANPTDDDE